MAYSTKGDVSTIAAGEDSEASGPSTTDAAADADQASAPLPDLTQPQKWPVWRKRVYIVLVGYCECLTFVILGPNQYWILSH